MSVQPRFNTVVWTKKIQFIKYLSMCKDGMLGKLKESRNMLSLKLTFFCDVNRISNRESNLLISGSATLRKNAQVQLFLFRKLYLNSQRSRRNSWHAGANLGHVSLNSTVTACLWGNITINILLVMALGQTTQVGLSESNRLFLGSFVPLKGRPLQIDKELFWVRSAL